MGKSKKRIFNKNKENTAPTLKRREVISDIILNIKNNKLDTKTKNMISLFGITLEELSEAGATYEELSAVKPLIF